MREEMRRGEMGKGAAREVTERKAQRKERREEKRKKQISEVGGQWGLEDGR